MENMEKKEWIIVVVALILFFIGGIILINRLLDERPLENVPRAEDPDQRVVIPRPKPTEIVEVTVDEIYEKPDEEFEQLRDMEKIRVVGKLSAFDVWWEGGPGGLTLTGIKERKIYVVGLKDGRAIPLWERRVPEFLKEKMAIGDTIAVEGRLEFVNQLIVDADDIERIEVRKRGSR